MGDIIKFKPRVVNSERNRVEALVKGKLETYTCNTCGERFEVLFDDRPECCPGCFARIKWE